MLRYAKQSDEEVFLIGTEEGILHPLRKQNPEKEFHIIAGNFICTDMKKTTLETLFETMQMRSNVVTVAEEIRVRAKQAIDRMLAIT
jgi:quinolinate synthase